MNGWLCYKITVLKINFIEFRSFKKCKKFVVFGNSHQTKTNKLIKSALWPTKNLRTIHPFGPNSPVSLRALKGVKATVQRAPKQLPKKKFSNIKIEKNSENLTFITGFRKTFQLKKLGIFHINLCRVVWLTSS